MNVWGITSGLWYSCCIIYGFRDCEFAHSSLYFATQGHSMIACMMTVWVLCGDRGLSSYVTLCPINAQ